MAVSERAISVVPAASRKYRQAFATPYPRSRQQGGAWCLRGSRYARFRKRNGFRVVGCFPCVRENAHGTRRILMADFPFRARRLEGVFGSGHTREAPYRCRSWCNRLLGRRAALYARTHIGKLCISIFPVMHFFRKHSAWQQLYSCVCSLLSVPRQPCSCGC